MQTCRLKNYKAAVMMGLNLNYKVIHLFCDLQ